MWRSLGLALCLAQPVAGETLNLCWTGANGYTMTGRMTLPDGAMLKGIVTEADVTDFKISGYREGRFLGSWSAADRRAGATWHLRFDPVAMIFRTGGNFPGTDSQGWNADGEVRNCGNPGFGFNSGNYAQDICLNGAYVSDSSIDPSIPLHATRAPLGPDCESVAATSKSPKREINR